MATLPMVKSASSMRRLRARWSRMPIGWFGPQALSMASVMAGAFFTSTRLAQSFLYSVSMPRASVVSGFLLSGIQVGIADMATEMALGERPC
ncbi:hypothetical protein AB0C95_25850 [Streptomyces caniferus]|uniref:hypothetical protein n=1 Tax=Streptomyces caniferus TaxID=285557 RepID=UPI0033F1ED16